MIDSILNSGEGISFSLGKFGNETLIIHETLKARDKIIFSVRGDLVFENLNDIGETIKVRIEQSVGDTFLLDLSGVGRIDSFGVQIIASAYLSVYSRKGKFAVVGPNVHVKTVLHTVGFAPPIINIYENENEALKSI